MKMKKGLWLCIVLAIGLLITVTVQSATAAGDTIKLRVAAGATYATGVGPHTMGKMIEEVEKATGGRIKFNILPGAVPEPAIYDSVIKGAYDMGMNPVMYNSGRFPIMEAMTFPDIGTMCRYPSKAAWDCWKNSEISKQVDKEFSDGKLIGVFAASPAPFGICLATSKKPVRKMEDIKGMKIGIYGQWQTKVVKAIGAIDVAVPPPAVYEDMQRKIIDGSFIDPEFLETQKLKEIGKYLHALTSLFVPFWVTMNQKTWDSLPPDIQKIITDEAVKIPDYGDKYLYDIEWHAINSAKNDYGWELIYYSDEELAKFQAAQAPIKADFIKMLDKKGLEGKKIMDTWKALYAKYKE